MKKYLFSMLLCMTLGFVGCSDDDDELGGTTTGDDPNSEYTTYDVTVQLVYPDDSEYQASEGVSVTISSSSSTSTYDGTTDSNGQVVFQLPAGIYSAVASESHVVDNTSYMLNGNTADIVINEDWSSDDVVTITMVESVSGQIIIKELYNGGCQKDDGSGTYQYDKYVILYNNSAETATLDNLCLGMCMPYNAHASGYNDYENGELVYASEGYIPAINGIWYTQQEVTIEPGQQIVIAILGAIDHTQTYTNSVDLSNADYCCYDMEDYYNTNYYPSPSENIPTDHYMLAYKYGQGNAWPLSVNSPAFFIFTTEDETPEEFASNPDYHYTGGQEGNAVYCCAKVPNEWILDGIEVYSEGREADSQKRLTPDIDAGYTLLTNYYGHTSYRNVNQEATEALAENEGKLVYDYAYGDDPSGIDAEASLANGARIIYLDTNNSTNDFHQRIQSSLKD